MNEEIPMHETPTLPSSSPETAPRKRRKVAATLVALGAVGVIGGTATWSVFTGTTQNPGNQFNAADIELTDNDVADAPMFNVANMQPGDTVTKCIRVTYTGTTDAEVRLYASAKGTGTLNDDLDVVVKRGQDAGLTNAGDCGAFVEDGPVVLTHGALTVDSFPGTFVGGLDGSAWVSAESHVYQFAITLNAAVSNTEAGAAGGPVTFTWEAQPTP